MFTFYRENETPVADSGRHVAEVAAGHRSMRSLLTAVGRALDFPGYFGKNFDAFWDCVRDLEGLDAKQVILLHDDLPRMAREDLLVYVALLRDAVLYWKKHGDEHEFSVWFPRKTKRKVLSLLHNAEPAFDED